ncbi:MAG TPA: gas vesicle protein [Propionibacteriaceae bacterium]|nr:gas vesicle protein [Propionibacteriaceae bacterium]
MTSDAGRLPRIQGPGTRDYLQKTQPRSDSLADVLERVLDKGIVIVGDIQIRLLDIELLTIKLRLMVASVERAREMGINWWESDEYITRLDDAGDQGELSELTRRLEALEGRMNQSKQADSKHAGKEEEARGRS